MQEYTRELIEKAKQLINENKLAEAEKILLPIDTEYSIFELAKIKQIQGNDNDAEKLYKKVLEINANSNTSWLELARIYARQRRVDLAKEFYNKYLDKVKDNADVYKEMAMLYESIGDNIQSVKSIEKASSISPDDIPFSIFKLIPTGFFVYSTATVSMPCTIFRADSVLKCTFKIFCFIAQSNITPILFV